MVVKLLNTHTLNYWSQVIQLASLSPRWALQGGRFVPSATSTVRRVCEATACLLPRELRCCGGAKHGLDLQRLPSRRVAEVRGFIAVCGAPGRWVEAFLSSSSAGCCSRGGEFSVYQDTSNRNSRDTQAAGV